MIKKLLIRGRRPVFKVQQLAMPYMTSDPLMADCLLMRTFIEDADYYDERVNGFRGSVVKRRIDGQIFFVPDYRFCRDFPAFEVLWFYDRRTKR